MHQCHLWVVTRSHPGRRAHPRCRLWIGARCAGISAARLYRDRVRGIAEAGAAGLRALRLAGRGPALPGDRVAGRIRRHLGLREFAACADGGAPGCAAASRACAQARRGALCLVQVRSRGAGAWRSAVYGSGRGGARGAGRGGDGVRGGRDLGYRGSAGGALFIIPTTALMPRPASDRAVSPDAVGGVGVAAARAHAGEAPRTVRDVSARRSARRRSCRRDGGCGSCARR